MSCEVKYIKENYSQHPDYQRLTDTYHAGMKELVSSKLFEEKNDKLKWAKEGTSSRIKQNKQAQLVENQYNVLVQENKGNVVVNISPLLNRNIATYTHGNDIKEFAINGSHFYITENGEYQINGETVSDKEFYDRGFNDYLDNLNQNIQPSEIKPGVEEVFNSSPELANIGSKEEYSQYLDTIFPDSKVKDVVYRGFNKDVKNSRTGTKIGIWFNDNKDIADAYTIPHDSYSIQGKILYSLNYKNFKSFFNKEGIFIGSIKDAKMAFREAIELMDEYFDKNDDNKVIFLLESYYKVGKDSENNIEQVLINIQNPKIIEGTNDVFETEEKLKIENNDSFIIYNFKGANGNLQGTNYVVFETEQIHILGSKQDVEGFKEFVNSQTQLQQPSKLTEEGKSLFNSTFNKVDNNKSIVYANYLADGEIALKNILDTISRLHIYENYRSENRLKELSKKQSPKKTLQIEIQRYLDQGLSIEDIYNKKVKEVKDKIKSLKDTLDLLKENKSSKGYIFASLLLGNSAENEAKNLIEYYNHLLEQFLKGGVELFENLIEEKEYSIYGDISEEIIDLLEQEKLSDLSKYYRNLLNKQIKEIKENFFIGELSKKGNPTDRNIFNNLTDSFIENFILEGQESITVQILKDLSNETSINHKSQNLTRELERRLDILKNKKNGHYLMTILNLKEYNEKLKALPVNLKENVSKIEQIKNEIYKTLPKEIADQIIILEDVPKEILGNENIFYSIKNILNDNGIRDEILINWMGIRNNSLKIHPSSIKTENQIEEIIKRSLKNKQKVENYNEFKTNSLALESFHKWNKALESFPLAFQEVMLTHALKWMNNPDRESKYVLQLSSVALQNAYGIVMNKPHELNRIGKLYDQEVLKTVSDAVEHEPSASGKGYWIHIPRTERVENTKDSRIKSLKKSIEISNRYKKDIEVLNKQITEFKNGKYSDIHTTLLQLKWNNELGLFQRFNSYDPKKNEFGSIELKQYRLTPFKGLDVLERELKTIQKYIVNESTIEKEIENIKNEIDTSEVYKKNIELLRKLSPSTWCTASNMASHYVENYDNYLLIVDGITVVGIEATSDYTSDNPNLESELKGLKTSVEADGGTIDERERIIEIEKQLINKKIKRRVKEVTSRANNGVASIDHLDDTIAFFEKHNLDLDNRTIQAAIKAKKQGKKDREIDIEAQNAIDYDYYQGGWGDFYPDDDADDIAGEYRRDREEEQIMQEIEIARAHVAAIETLEEALTDESLSAEFFHELKPEFRTNERLARLAIGKDSHNITYVDSTLPFYKELVIQALNKNINVFPYLSDDIKLDLDVLKLYDERKYFNIDDELPFSKTSSNAIQGYYDSKKDKVVIIASNTPIDEASVVAIHEIAHRGLIRMAKELGGSKELNKILLNSEKELMKALPELLKRTGHKTKEALLLDYGFENNEEGKIKLLSELVARWAEKFVNQSQPSWWKEFISSIKKWIEQFTNNILSEQEVNEFIAGVVKYGSQQELGLAPLEIKKCK